MAKSKVYELAIKINGKLDSSLKKACAADAPATTLPAVFAAFPTVSRFCAAAAQAFFRELSNLPLIFMASS